MKTIYEMILNIFINIIMFYTFSLIFYLIGNAGISFFGLNYAYSFNMAMGTTAVAYFIRFFMKAVTFKVTTEVTERGENNENND